MSVRTGREAVINPVEFRVTSFEDLWFFERDICTCCRVWVYAEAHEVRVDGARLGTVPLCVWPPEEDVFVAEAEVDYEITV